MNVDIRGVTVNEGDVIAVARTNYRVAQLLVGLVTEITDTRVYYDCNDEGCTMRHWVVHQDNSYSGKGKHKRTEIMLLARGVTQYDFMNKFVPFER